MKRKEQDTKIIYSDEYETYLKALCRLASRYVSRIRVQFAEKAYDMYSNETVRRLVLAYGEEAEKLDGYRLSDFRHASFYGADRTEFLDDSCLSNAEHYRQALVMLFDIV